MEILAPAGDFAAARSAVHNGADAVYVGGRVLNARRAAKGFSGEELKELCKPIRLCPECTDCEDRKSCMNCAAVTFAETGDFAGKPEYMCRLNRAYRKTLLELAEQLKT